MNEQYKCELERNTGKEVRLKDLPPMSVFSSYNVTYIKLGDFSEVYEHFSNKYYRPTPVVNVHTGRVVFHSDDCLVTPHKSKLIW